MTNFDYDETPSKQRGFLKFCFFFERACNSSFSKVASIFCSKRDKCMKRDRSKSRFGETCLWKWQRCLYWKYEIKWLFCFMRNFSVMKLRFIFHIVLWKPYTIFHTEHLCLLFHLAFPLLILFKLYPSCSLIIIII